LLKSAADQNHQIINTFPIVSQKPLRLQEMIEAFSIPVDVANGGGSSVATF